MLNGRNSREGKRVEDHSREAAPFIRVEHACVIKVNGLRRMWDSSGAFHIQRLNLATEGISLVHQQEGAG